MAIALMPCSTCGAERFAHCTAVDWGDAIATNVLHAARRNDAAEALSREP